ATRSWFLLGKGDDNFRSGWAGTDSDLPAVSFDNAFSNRHAQTRAFGLGGEKWVEDSLPLFGIQAGAVVFDGDSKRRLPININRGARDFDLGGISGCSQRILEDVAKDLL